MTTPGAFNAIAGQQHPIRLLKTLLRNGTLPHALLFTGDAGVGKRLTATALAKACNCRTLRSTLDRSLPLDAVDACGRCDPCRKIEGNHHPDIIHVAPHPSVIRIAQIRALLQALTLKPHEADRRVVILSDAQAMNAEAGNALLKALEEPPDRTLMVLTAHQAADLLPTVVSRCRQMRFAPLCETDIEGLLTADGDIEPGTAAAVARVCGGSYTRARTLVDQRWLSRREWVMQALQAQLTGPQRNHLRGWLALSEMLARRRDLIEETLAIMTTWLRDLLVIRIDPQRVLNRDRLEVLAAVAQQVDPTLLIAQIDAVDGALAALRSNTNVRLTLDAMALQMAGAGI
jgi:DNA polymerase-3 subunit delta'